MDNIKPLIQSGFLLLLLRIFCLQLLILLAPPSQEWYQECEGESSRSHSWRNLEFWWLRSGFLSDTHFMNGKKFCRKHFYSLSILFISGMIKRYKTIIELRTVWINFKMWALIMEIHSKNVVRDSEKKTLIAS